MTGLLVVASVLAIAAAALTALRLPLLGALERVAGVALLSQAFASAVLLFCGLIVRNLDGLAITTVAALAFTIVAVVTLMGPGRRIVARALEDLVERGRSGFRQLPRTPIVSVVMAAALLALAWRLVLAIRLPTLDYDGLAYHLVTVDVWLQGNVMGRIPERIWSDGYPANGELLTLWLMAFSRTDALADLTGLLPLPLAGFAVAGVARELGARRDWAALVGTIVVITPAVIGLANTTYVDNVALATIAGAWFFGLRAVRAGGRSRQLALLGLTGIAMGLGVGTKASLIIPLAVFAIVVIVAVIRQSMSSEGRAAFDVRWALAVVVALGGLTILFGGWWYVRDLVVFGDPLWPFTIGPFQGIARMEDLIVQTPHPLVGHGRLAQIALAWVGDLSATRYAYDTRIGGFGVLWLPAVAVAVVGTVRFAIRRRWVVLAGLIAPVTATLLIMPMPWWARLTLFALALGLAVAGATLSQLGGRWRSTAMLGAAAAALFSLVIVTRVVNTGASVTASRPGGLELVKLVLADDATRQRLGLWAECEGFAVMRDGTRFASDGFNLPHLAIGPNLERTLVPDVGRTSDPAELRTEVSANGADYIALISASTIAAARSDPDHFMALGPVCRGAELFEVLRPA